jgi:urease accessory protein
MLVAGTYLGHRDDPVLADRLADADPARVVLSDTERRRSRVRTETSNGRDLGVVVARDLDDGDVLATEDGDLVVVELAAVDALVLSFDGVDVSSLAALELGHALGNRHWDLALRDDEALFPVADTRERMEAAVADHLPDGVGVRFEHVSPATFDDDGDHSHPHSHGDEAAHGHGDGDPGVRTADGGGR